MRPASANCPRWNSCRPVLNSPRLSCLRRRVSAESLPVSLGGNELADGAEVAEAARPEWADGGRLLRLSLAATASSSKTS